MAARIGLLGLLVLATNCTGLIDSSTSPGGDSPGSGDGGGGSPAGQDGGAAGMIDADPDSLRARTSAELPWVGAAVAVDPLLADPRYVEVLGREYNSVTAENALKWALTEPEPGVFTFEGSDEMDPVRGTGTAELTEDGTLDIEIAYHYGDEAQLKARRW